jgi:hypothetical protein
MELQSYADEFGYNHVNVIHPTTLQSLHVGSWKYLPETRRHCIAFTITNFLPTLLLENLPDGDLDEILARAAEHAIRQQDEHDAAYEAEISERDAMNMTEPPF